jgi:hypothetical protein
LSCADGESFVWGRWAGAVGLCPIPAHDDEAVINGAAGTTGRIGWKGMSRRGEWQVSGSFGFAQDDKIGWWKGLGFVGGKRNISVENTSARGVEVSPPFRHLISGDCHDATYRVDSAVVFWCA